MNVVTDIYEYIACLTDDATTLNMLSVNKKFLDEDYYRRIIQKKFPYLAKMKNYGKPFEYKHVFKQYTERYDYMLTWRQCYIKNLYFILKFQEKFQLSYFYIKFHFPERLLNRLSREKNPYSYILHRALEQNRCDIRDNIFERKLVRPSNSYLSASCRSGDLMLVKETYYFLLINLKKIHLESGICNAVRNNSLDILKFLLENGNDLHVNYALLRSCGNEDDTMMKYLISKGANNFTECILFLQQRINASKSFKVESHQFHSFQKYLSSLSNKLKFFCTYLYIDKFNT